MLLAPQDRVALVHRAAPLEVLPLLLLCLREDPNLHPLTWAFCEHLPAARGRAGSTGQIFELSHKAPLQFCLRQKITRFSPESIRPPHCSVGRRTAS